MACGRSCSPATTHKRPPPWPASWVSARSTPGSCRPIRSAPSPTCRRRARPDRHGRRRRQRRPRPGRRVQVSIALGGISSGAAHRDRRHRAHGRRPPPPSLADPPQPRDARANPSKFCPGADHQIDRSWCWPFFGLANLWMAIAADVGTSLVVIANALRLLRGPKS